MKPNSGENVKNELSQLLRATRRFARVLLWIDLPLRQNKTAPAMHDNINRCRSSYTAPQGLCSHLIQAVVDD
jgi:hypothetical protein